MTVDQVKKYLYWADSQGRIWRRESYCLEPTVTFVRMTAPGPSDCEKPHYLGGAIGCLNVSDLEPIEMPQASDSARVDEGKDNGR